MAKVTDCKGCPESSFDPKTLKPGDRVIYNGMMCIVTAQSDAASLCGYNLLALSNGVVYAGGYNHYKKPTTPWLIED